MMDAVQAIAEPRRRAILRLVRDHELSVSDIAAEFDVTQPAVSQHLKVLENTGLVSVRAAGTRRLYRLRPDGLLEIRAFVEELWNARLDRLRDAVETDADGGT